MRVGIDGETTLAAAVAAKFSENQRGCCCTSRQTAWCQPAINAGRDRWRNNSGCGSRCQIFGEPAWLLLHITSNCVVPTSSKCGSGSMEKQLWLRQSLPNFRRTSVAAAAHHVKLRGANQQ